MSKVYSSPTLSVRDSVQDDLRRFGAPAELTQAQIGKAPQLELSTTSLQEMFRNGETDFRTMAKAELLLGKAFDVYCKCFPDPNERESLENLRGYLQNREMNWDMMVLQNAATGQVLGFRTLNILETTFRDNGIEKAVIFAQGEHLGVDPEERLKGYSKVLIAETEKLAVRKGASFLTSEQNDPYMMTVEDIRGDLNSGITPSMRLEFWKRNGYQALNIPYMQPGLDGGEEVRYLLWAMKPLDAKFNNGLPGDLALSAMRSFHATFVEDMAGDPTSRELVKLLHGQNGAGLIPLGSRRSFSQARPGEDLAVDSEDPRIRKGMLEKDLELARQLLG